MKYMGSKRKIADNLIHIMKQHLNGENYFVDLFCGGCNLLDKLNYKKVIANDKNVYLIEMWKTLITDTNKLSKINKIDKELYVKYRNKYNNRNVDEADIIGWIGFMGSYNGRFFDGGYSGHDVKGRDYIGEQIRNTLGQVDSLSDVEFVSGDYCDVALPQNSVIYCDIPYENTKQYATSKNFDYTKFWEWVRATSKDHVVFVSEYNAPEDFTCMWQQQVTNSLNTKNTYRPVEKLFTFN